ncbi:hypothetical protein D9M69_302310 [compost metagenome]
MKRLSASVLMLESSALWTRKRMLLVLEGNWSGSMDSSTGTESTSPASARTSRLPS